MRGRLCTQSQQRCEWYVSAINESCHAWQLLEIMHDTRPHQASFRSNAGCFVLSLGSYEYQPGAFRRAVQHMNHVGT